jgi:hypothetical protein
MANSMAKDICASWVGIQSECYDVSTKASLRMRIVMVDANGMCGQLLWLWMDLGVGIVFGSFYFWTQGIWDNPSSNGLCLAHGTCNTELYLDVAPCLGLNLNNLFLGDNLFWGYMFCFHFVRAEV